MIEQDNTFSEVRPNIEEKLSEHSNCVIREVICEFQEVLLHYRFTIAFAGEKPSCDRRN